ncbi:retinol dehydrogenase [Pyrenophora tritici-repentis]|nr:retinol dehydrogenase [Pyrenophora tritici-repentis]
MDEIYSRLIFKSGIGFIYRQTSTLTANNHHNRVKHRSGFEAARQLLQLNLSRLVLAVRSETKGNFAAETLRKEFPHAQIEVWILDMEDPESVSAFATKCQNLGRLDMVILNAGVQNKDYVLSAKTGREQTFQVNYLSTIMLAVLLLPILKSKASLAGKPARLTVVTSTTAYFADFDHKKAILTAV